MSKKDFSKDLESVSKPWMEFLEALVNGNIQELTDIQSNGAKENFQEYSGLVHGLNQSLILPSQSALQIISKSYSLLRSGQNKFPLLNEAWQKAVEETEVCLKVCSHLLTKDETIESSYMKLKQKAAKDLVQKVIDREITELKRQAEADIFLEGIGGGKGHVPVRDHRTLEQKEASILLDINREVKRLSENRLVKRKSVDDNRTHVEELRVKRLHPAEQASDAIIKSAQIEKWKRDHMEVPE